VSPPIEFDTDRLCLRQWQSSDREPFAALNGDARVMEFFPATLDRTTSDAAIDRWQSQIAERGWGLWAAELRDSHTFIGFVGLQVSPESLSFSPSVEIGWRLAYEYWGKGLATEAARGALRVGFERLQLAEIVSYTAVINRRSRAVMQRLGMQEAVTTFEHPAVPEGSPIREHCLYRLSREKWIATCGCINARQPGK
jgi:RimJ/RimL family protein N-acetyltransferase